MMKGSDMNKVLVAYATKTGCTQGIAEKIGSTLSGAGMEVDVRSIGEMPEADGYDAFIVGSGVRVGSWHGAAKSWVKANAEPLRSRPTAFFTACLTMVDGSEKSGEVRAYTDALIAETNVEPVEIGLFAGMNDPKKFSFPERLILKALKSPQGDFRDMEAVAAWTREIAPKLGMS